MATTQSEIAAGMLLLHNKPQPLRGDMLQRDQDWLNDISDKRMKMQDAYRQRQAMAYQLSGTES